eukprot:CAMPEP_0204364418 /NCGR_PEP_ID=MMETSP0469-20131031/41127_1 /ASSEMBLY_ACC=CAM_ASM_000384 /TAXON_ID=2969 /ORGANISM="Oxyrrhis marina" /LENGTH=84 /DNA_ID=CAMNT_0051353313 /DNA_START=186 /DNA_END=436 /DNA_ORIENTATION=-
MRLDHPDKKNTSNPDKHRVCKVGPSHEVLHSSAPKVHEKFQQEQSGEGVLRNIKENLRARIRHCVINAFETYRSWAGAEIRLHP